MIVAVGDGLSSSRFADLGATVATSSAVRVLREQLNARTDPAELPATTVFDAVANDMVDAATARQLSAADVATVLLLAVIPAHAEAGEDRTAWVSWVGDTSTWTLRSGRWWFTAGDRKDDAAGPVSNAVEHVLPTDPGAASSTLLRVRAEDVLAFVTDGVGDAIATLDTAAEHFANRWQRPPPVATFLDDVNYDAKQFLDDRTAVVVWSGATGRRGGARR